MLLFFVLKFSIVEERVRAGAGDYHFCGSALLQKSVARRESCSDEVAGYLVRSIDLLVLKVDPGSKVGVVFQCQSVGAFILVHLQHTLHKTVGLMAERRWKFNLIVLNLTVDVAESTAEERGAPVVHLIDYAAESPDIHSWR